MPVPVVTPRAAHTIRNQLASISRRSLGSGLIFPVLLIAYHKMPTILQTAIAGGLLGVTVYLGADVAGDYTTYVILRYFNAGV